MKVESSTWSLLACTGWGLSWVTVGTALLVEITSCSQGSTHSWLVSLMIGVPLATVSLLLLAVAAMIYAYWHRQRSIHDRRE